MAAAARRHRLETVRSVQMTTVSAVAGREGGMLVSTACCSHPEISCSSPSAKQLLRLPGGCRGETHQHRVQPLSFPEFRIVAGTEGRELATGDPLSMAVHEAMVELRLKMLGGGARAECMRRSLQ